MDKVRNFKFGVRVDPQAYRPTNAKVGQTARGLHHVTYIYNFCAPAISMKKLKEQTSNVVHRLITRGTIHKCKQVLQQVACPIIQPPVDVCLQLLQCRTTSGRCNCCAPEDPTVGRSCWHICQNVHEETPFSAVTNA